MSAPWMDRLPTPEEVEAHAKAHGVDGTSRGLWMARLSGDDVPRVGWLEARDHVRLWSTAREEWVDLDANDRVCPLTARGLPVALVTEVERLRASERISHQTMTERDRLAEHVDEIHALTGCEQEWSNVHDCDACAVKGVAEMRAELERLRAEVGALSSYRSAMQAHLTKKGGAQLFPASDVPGDFPMGPGWGVYRSGAGEDQ